MWRMIQGTSEGHAHVGDEIDEILGITNLTNLLNPTIPVDMVIGKLSDPYGITDFNHYSIPVPKC
jgi:hypothetical protein